METKAAKLGRPKAATEPAVYVGVTKTCPFCGATQAAFKFLNNKSMEQPRYKCLGCNKFFTHNPSSRRKKHPQGYSHIGARRSGDGATAPQLPNDATVSCPNPSCGQVGTSKFLFFNNGKLTQPRYKCAICTTTFTHGGRLSSKRNLDQQIPALQVVADFSTAQLFSLKNKSDDDSGEQCGSVDVHTARPTVFGTCNKKVKLSSRPKAIEDEFDDSSDGDSEIDDDERAWLEEMAKWDVLRHMHVENKQDSDSDDDEEEPSEFVDTLKPCNWCKSPNTEFCKSLNDCGLLEYQCQDCCAHLKFDGATKTVLPIERQSRTTKYNLRFTRASVESENKISCT